VALSDERFSVFDTCVFVNDVSVQDFMFREWGMNGKQRRMGETVVGFYRCSPCLLKLKDAKEPQRDS